MHDPHGYMYDVMYDFFRIYRYGGSYFIFISACFGVLGWVVGDFSALRMCGLHGNWVTGKVTGIWTTKCSMTIYYGFGIGIGLDWIGKQILGIEKWDRSVLWVRIDIAMSGMRLWFWLWFDIWIWLLSAPDAVPLLRDG